MVCLMVFHLSGLFDCKIFKLELESEILRFFKALTVMTFINTKPLESGSYVYPRWAHILGQLMSFSTLSGTLIWAAWLIIRNLFITKEVEFICIIKNDINFVS